MITWLQQDVLSTNLPWIVAFWHHPPYSKGSHNSDTEIELIEMRQNALPILEQGGIDMVLAGHSHSYERSFFLDGHYGLSTTFNDSMKKDGGDGRIDGQGAYGKPTTGPAPHEGTVYVVAGSSGQASGGLLNHPAMYLSLNTLGSLVLEVNGQRLDARFLDSGGVWRDYFTILKGPSTPPAADFAGAPTAGVAPLAVQFTDLSAYEPAAWAWDFDDNGSIDSQEQNPAHTYTVPGLFSIRLTASNGAGSCATVRPDLVCAISADGLADADGDSVADRTDLCPCVFDPAQEDTDNDTLGDPCDPDDDNDGVPDQQDCARLDPGISAPPADIGGSVSLGPAAGDISWTAVPQASAFNVYRGHHATGLPFIYNHACLESRSPDAASTDPEPPAAGECFYYLVSAWNVCGEGSLGVDSAGQLVPNPAACP
jgi:PKD repeat protein